MTPLEALQIASALFEAAKNIKQVTDDLKAMGHKDSAPIPPEHEQKIRAIVDSLPDTEWDKDHENSGG
jgi:hypothetical protein